MQQNIGMQYLPVLAQVQYHIAVNHDVITINVREYGKGHQKWTIQGNWQHRRRQINKNTTQYVLATTIRKQTINLCYAIKRVTARVLVNIIYI